MSLSAGVRGSPSLRVLGVMTGTSCDALDAACIEANADGWKLLWSDSSPYPSRLRARVLALQRAHVKVSLRDWLELHAELGEWYGKTLAALIARHRPAPQVIANHGQTVGHFPAPSRARRKKGTTLQLGDPTRIAHATGLTVVAGFRDGDMAAGGQGAPLVPLFHRLLARTLDPDGCGVAIHNIGGISNLTYVPPEGSGLELIAFDTGPGNIWIDAAASAVTRGKLKMDRGGRLAQKGRPDYRALRAVLEHPYFAKPAPKSTGRDDFPFSLLTRETRARDESLVTTATLVTVESIAEAYERWVLGRQLPLERIYFCGGGAHNPVLLRALADRLPSVQVHTIGSAGLDPQLIESQAFAMYGFMALLGHPLGGDWTGARGYGPPAHLIPGENWQEVVATIQGFLR
ncbi:MAG: anhydro-N-acetylmuramic acid kinase [Oligoflexia bacterium]|nr:anhydro-N-acetylmuramic acid kinase [Oligoflexia bacterium]